MMSRVVQKLNSSFGEFFFYLGDFAEVVAPLGDKGFQIST